jgi:hypothetical protein
MVPRVAVSLLQGRGERGDHIAVAELSRGVAILGGNGEDRCPAATVGACLLQSRPSCGKQGLGFLPALQLRHPHRRRDTPDCARLEILELDQDSVDRFQRPGGGRLGQQHCELIASHPAGEIVNTGLLADQGAYRRQHRIARRVAMLEVDLAKPVDVEQGNGQRAPIAIRAPHVELVLGPEGAGAEQARDQPIPL